MLFFKFPKGAHDVDLRSSIKNIRYAIERSMVDIASYRTCEKHDNKTSFTHEHTVKMVGVLTNLWSIKTL